MSAKELYSGLFSRYALEYKLRHDEIDRQGKNRGRARMLELVSVQPGERVADLACGPAKLTGRLVAAAGPLGLVAGVDLAPGMLRLAAAEVAQAGFLRMDIECLAFASGAFDAAVCGHGLQFCPDLGAALAEALRVLHSGGRFGASVPADPPGQRAWEVFNACLDRRVPPRPLGEESAATRATVGNLDALGDAAAAAGFDRVVTERVMDTTVWVDPRQMVQVSMGWWSIAHRLEDLSDAARSSLLEEVVEALERTLGPGPIETHTVDHVLLGTKS